MLGKYFDAFLTKVKTSLRRIVAATRNEISVGDLHSDAWLVAHEIGEKRGRAIDFTDPADQDLIVGALHIRNVKRQEKHVRYAARIDAIDHDDDGEAHPRWENRLRAHATSDPLELLMLEQEMARQERAIASSYSEYAAYGIVLYNFDDDRAKLCAYLLIAKETLARRMAAAEHQVRLQSSLFDHIERIERSFVPLPGSRYAVKVERHAAGEQFAWAFA